MNDIELANSEEKGFGKVKAVLHTATLLYKGWEMDNHGWIVEIEDGSKLALTTSHGGLYRWAKKEAEEKLRETEASAESIRKALELWPGDDQ